MRKQYTDTRWDICEVRSSNQRPIRVHAVSDNQAKFKARKESGRAWLEHAIVYPVQMYRIECQIGDRPRIVFASGINSTDAVAHAANTLEVSSLTTMHILRLDSLWNWLQSRGLDPKKNAAYSAEEELAEEAVLEPVGATSS